MTQDEDGGPPDRVEWGETEVGVGCAESVKTLIFPNHHECLQQQQNTHRVWQDESSDINVDNRVFNVH